MVSSRVRNAKTGSTGRSNNGHSQNQRPSTALATMQHREISQWPVPYKKEKLRDPFEQQKYLSRLKCKKPSMTSSQFATSAVVNSVCSSLSERYEGRHSLKKIFNSWDTNGDGVIDRSEMATALSKLGCVVTEGQSDVFFDYFADGGNKISYNTFLDCVFHEPKPEVKRQSQIENLESRLRGLGVEEGRIANVGKFYSPHMKTEQIVEILQTKFQAKASITRVFRDIDEDKNGNISRDEMSIFLNNQGIYLNPSEFDDLFRRFDVSGDNEIQYHEFVDVVFPDAVVQFPNSKKQTSEQNERNVKFQDAVEESKIEESELQYSSNHTLEGDALGIAQIRHRVISSISKNFGDINKAFKKIDVNGDGRLSYDEFKQVTTASGFNISDGEADVFLAFIDKNNSGFVDLEELREVLNRTSSNSSNNEEYSFGMVNRKRNRNRNSHHSTKTATMSNIGHAQSSRMPNKQEAARCDMKRKILPVQFSNMTTSKGDPSQLLKHSPVKGSTIKSAHNKDTRYLIQADPHQANVAGSYACDPSRRYETEAGCFSLDKSRSYFNSVEAQRDHLRTQSRIEKRRNNRNLMETPPAQIVEPVEDVTHLRSIMFHRLSYHRRVEPRLQRERERVDKANI